jgi:hypothetical protein
MVICLMYLSEFAVSLEGGVENPVIPVVGLQIACRSVNFNIK